MPIRRMQLFEYILIVSLSLLCSCASPNKVSVQDMARVSKPVNSFEQFNGTYQVSNGEISDIFWLLPYHAKTLRITNASATQLTLIAIDEDDPVQTSTINVGSDQGYLFLFLKRTAYTHDLEAHHITSTTGLGIDAKGNLHWRSDVRNFITMFFIVPEMWLYSEKVGSAKRIQR